MIPKVVHYCWFGRRPLPKFARKCIASWKRFLPDYEIKEWNEENFNVNIIQYTAEAYSAKKYAFVSDYARFWILYHHGGLYFDTDVEMIRPMNEVIARGPFMGCETVSPTNNCINGGSVNPGLGLGANSGLSLYKEILTVYSSLRFINANGSFNQTPVCHYTTLVLARHGLENFHEIQYIAGVYIYPEEWFCPKSWVTGRLSITNNTCCIHHFSGSWHDLPWYRKKGREWLALYGIKSRTLFDIIQRIKKWI